jgi:cholest-4-en-3-one 26-monooxygenase
MVMYYIAANRDPDTFTDPHRFDPWRKETGSLVFGSAHHRCIGAALARLELTILFEEMTKRNVRLQLAGEPKRGWSNFINQLIELPVSLASGK